MAGQDMGDNGEMGAGLKEIDLTSPRDGLRPGHKVSSG
jgi:hypothetical protein